MNIKREAGLDPDTPTFLDGPSPHGASPNHHHHHHLSPPPNRVVISLRDEDRENNQPMVSMVSSSAAATPRKHSQGGAGANTDGLDTGERMSTRVDLRGEEEVLEEGCVRVSPTMADDYPNGIRGDYGGGEETYEREIAERESYEREIADRESYERELVQQEQDMMVENQAQEEREEEERRIVEEEEEVGGMEEEEGRMEQEGVDQEEEEEEEGLRIEGPQPTLEASDDDLVDNLPVFPVPQLQPVTSA